MKLTAAVSTGDIRALVVWPGRLFCLICSKDDVIKHLRILISKRFHIANLSNRQIENLIFSNQSAQQARLNKPIEYFTQELNTRLAQVASPSISCDHFKTI